MRELTVNSRQFVGIGPQIQDVTLGSWLLVGEVEHVVPGNSG